MVVLLNIRVNCSLFASKPAHFSGHLPLGSPIMSFLLFALPCFSCKDAPLTGSCVPKPGVETRHPRFVRRDDTSPLRGTRALNWPAMASSVALPDSFCEGRPLTEKFPHPLSGWAIHFPCEEYRWTRLVKSVAISSHVTSHLTLLAC